MNDFKIGVNDIKIDHKEIGQGRELFTGFMSLRTGTSCGLSERR